MGAPSSSPFVPTYPIETGNSKLSA